MTFVCENIKYLRNYAGITQGDLANFVGLKKSNIGCYEERRGTPSYESIVKIAHLFEVTVHEIVTVDFKTQDILLNCIPDTKLYRISEYRERQSEMAEQSISLLRSLAK